MSESTYNKFTVHLRYVTTNNLANRPMIPCEGAHNPAPEVTAGGISPMHSCFRNPHMIQLRTRSAVATSSLWIEGQRNNDIAKLAAPPRPRQDQEVLLIRAFLRSQEGWSNCRHNSSGSVNGLRLGSTRQCCARSRAFQGPARRRGRREMTNLAMNRNDELVDKDVRQSAPQKNLTHLFHGCSKHPHSSKARGNP
jgi:hypothetical protein